MNSNRRALKTSTTGVAPKLDALLHPAGAFEHPRNVLADPELTLNEKRAILASWASDACAVETAPTLRQPAGADKPVTVDEILEALCELDKQAAAGLSDTRWARRQMRRQAIELYRAERRGVRD